MNHSNAAIVTVVFPCRNTVTLGLAELALLGLNIQDFEVWETPEETLYCNHTQGDTHLSSSFFWKFSYFPWSKRQNSLPSLETSLICFEDTQMHFFIYLDTMWQKFDEPQRNCLHELQSLIVSPRFPSLTFYVLFKKQSLSFFPQH